MNDDSTISGIKLLHDQLSEQTKVANKALETRDYNFFTELTYNLRNNPLFHVLYDVFMDLKCQYRYQAYEKFQPKVDVTLLEREQRLNQMLANENIIVAPNQGYRKVGKLANHLEQDEEYAQKLYALRNVYSEIMNHNQGNRYEICPRVEGQLQQQHLIRPIFPEDVQAMISNCCNKLDQFRLQVKLEVCQTAMTIRSKARDNGKKRRNFSKEATALLNDYYFAHLEHPYPDDTTKVWLADQTGLSVGQVSNWFGNKRIRYRQKQKKKEQKGVQGSGQMPDNDDDDDDKENRG